MSDPQTPYHTACSHPMLTPHAPRAPHAPPLPFVTQRMLSLRESLFARFPFRSPLAPSPLVRTGGPPPPPMPTLTEGGAAVDGAGADSPPPPPPPPCSEGACVERAHAARGAPKASVADDALGGAFRHFDQERRLRKARRESSVLPGAAATRPLAPKALAPNAKNAELRASTKGIAAALARAILQIRLNGWSGEGEESQAEATDEARWQMRAVAEEE